MTPEVQRAPSAAAVAVVVVVAVAVAASAASGSDWRDVLRDAAERAERQPYRGEALGVAWEDGQAHVTVTEVHHRPEGGLVLRASDDYTVTLDDHGGGIVNHEQGWLMPLPATEGPDADDMLAALDLKYIVRLVKEANILDRPCTVVEIARRGDDRLRERLWIDRATGLVLRRETFDGDELLRLGTYLSLDLDPAITAATSPSPEPRLVERAHGVVNVGDQGLDALRTAGWAVFDELPAGYRLTQVYALSAGGSQPLHLVYSDGMYSLSVFQQQGTPDWASLPDGAEHTDELGWQAYEWPGALPRRLVWEADGVTFTLVGDAPPDEFVAVAKALPHSDRHGFLERLRRNLGRLRAWVSPWE